MSNAIDSAASAFSADMNGGRAIQSESQPAAINLDDIFTPRQVETDVQAGGEDIIENDEKPKKASKVAKTREADEDIDTDVDPLYADDEADPKKVVKEEDDEDEDEDTEADDDEDGADEAEDIDLDEFGDKKVKIVVDGKEQTVPLREALDGFIREETFHQRLNKLNEDRGVLRTEATTLLQEREKSIALLEQLDSDLSGLLPEEPNWDELYAKDAPRARAIQKEFEGMKARLAGIRSRRDELTQQAQAERAKFTNDFAAQEKERFENLPENRHWQKDPKRQAKDLAAMVKTAKSVGLSNDEVRGVLDSRMLTILLRASKFDRIEAAKGKVKLATTGKKPARPRAGNPARGTAQRGLARDQQALARTGSVRDAAAVFSKLL